MVRLLEDFPQIVLFYKPKRNLALRPTDWFPRQATTYRELVESIRRHARGVVMDADINPWIPLSIADMCISVPGGSPTWHGLHHGIPGFFHDATQQMPTKEYPALQGLITHDYDTLKRRIQQTLWPEDAGERSVECHGADLQDYLGTCAGANANAAFRQWVTVRPPAEPDRHGASWLGQTQTAQAAAREATGMTR